MSLLKAFVAGGFICAIVQVVIDKTKLTPARILVILVVLGVALGGIGIYEKFVEFAGAGATVPLIGFGNAIAQGVKKAVAEFGLLGALSGGLAATAAGISASLFFSFVLAMVSRPKEK